VRDQCRVPRKFFAGLTAERSERGATLPEGPNDGPAFSDLNHGQTRHKGRVPERRTGFRLPITGCAVVVSPSVAANGSATQSSDQAGTAVTTMLSRKCLVVESNRPPHVTSTSLGGPRRSNTVSGKAVLG
jgi:hypothetical protein